MCFLSYTTPNYRNYFSKIIDIDVDDNDEEFLIWSDETIKDIRVLSVSYDDDGNQFSDEPTALIDNGDINIQVGDALKVNLSLPCGIPNHKIIVTGANGNTFTFIASLSGKNGSLGLLKDDDAFVWGALSFDDL